MCRFTLILLSYFLSCLCLITASQNAYAAEPLAKVEGDLPPALRSLIKDVIGEAETPPRSPAQARRRVEKARLSALSVLRSQGYYSAKIKAQLIESSRAIERDIEASKSEAKPPEAKPSEAKPSEAKSSEAKSSEAKPSEAKPSGPLQAILTITPDLQFKISPLNIIYMDGPPDIPQDLLELIKLRQGSPALSAKILAAEIQIINHLKSHGYPDARAHKRKAVVDHDSHTMRLTYNIETGLKTRFGEIEQTGSAYLVSSWPQMVAPFKSGDDFDIGKLNTLPSRILSTASFDSASAILSDKATLNDDGTVTRNVLLNIEQGLKNTLSGEAGFSTTDGSGLDISYQRRNFIGYAQSLTITATAKTNQISLGAHYNIPFAWRVDRGLDIAAEIAREDTDAFTGERIGGNILITQKLSKRLKASLGLGFEASKFETTQSETSQSENTEFNTTSFLIEGLGRASYDSRNNILNPSKGIFIEADFIPTYNFGEEDGFFTTTTLGASTYWRLSDKFIAASRAKIGTIFGGNLATIPLNRRFFGGGGGSVRGFGFQTISPINAQGELTGGRSLSEVSAELRYKGKGPLGFAAFIDGGSVTEREYPDFSDIRAGAGFGLRYHTSFAPLRADIAFPLNKRSRDDAFQLYISIGQAF